MKTSVVNVDLDGSAAPSAETQRLTAEDVYRRHGATVTRWVRRLASPNMEVDDLIQEIFIIVQRKLHTYDAARCQVTTWLYAITSKVLSDARKKARWRKRLNLFSSSEVEKEDVADSGATPEQTAHSRQLVAHLRKALEELPEKQRDALLLYEIEGMTVTEISELTGVPVNTLYVHIHRARQQLVGTFGSLSMERSLP